MTENEKYRNEHYPHFSPCDKCYYWRGANVVNRPHKSMSYPMCHYLLENNELRGCEPDLINGTCEKFIPVKEKKRGRTKFNAI